MIEFYQIRSPLSQVTQEHMEAFTAHLSQALNEELKKVELEAYLKAQSPEDTKVILGH